MIALYGLTSQPGASTVTRAGGDRRVPIGPPGGRGKLLRNTVTGPPASSGPGPDRLAYESIYASIASNSKCAPPSARLPAIRGCGVRVGGVHQAHVASVCGTWLHFGRRSP